jgi:PAS domain S-box-containing protein
MATGDTRGSLTGQGYQPDTDRASSSGQHSKVTMALLAGVLVVIIGLIDYHTGPEYSFSIFYLIPVILASWTGGFSSGALISLMSGAAWLLVERLSNPSYTSPIVPYWNASVRLGFFLGFAYLLAQRKAASQAVEESRRDLELRVAERTAELRETNQQLKQELTERERAERDLQKSEARLHLQISNMPFGCITWDAGFRVETWNPAAEKIFGFTEREAIGKHAFDLVVPESSRPHVEGIYRRLLAGESTSGSVVRNIAKDGRTVLCSWNSTPLRGADGSVYGILSMVEDITGRKQTEEAHARLALAVEQSTEAIMVTDPEANIVYVNPSFERATGYKREEVMGKNPRILRSGQHSPEFYHAMWDKLTHGQAWSGRMINRGKDGRLFEEEATIAPVYDESGRLVNYVAVKRDLTRERQLEQQLLQAQKMEAVGQLAGGIAHDFNNLLTIVAGYSQMLLDGLEPNHPMRGNVEEIAKAGDRAASLTRQLLAFSRRQILMPQVLGLNDVVDNMDRMLRRLIGENIELVTHMDPNLAKVRADPGQIEQVIMNLAVNARDAMPAGGKLTIETSNIELDNAYARTHATVAPGPHVMLAVSDSGMGMDAETQAHIFEPFFTTKQTGKGTGLGLATVYGIIKQSGGHIWLYSEPGRGTTFKIYFPEVTEVSRPALEEHPPVMELRGTETILLVEDQPEVRALAQVVLESQGYAVLTAAEPAQAIRIAGADDTLIHLLLTDVVMPTMNGVQLAEHLAFQRPQMKVLYMSGYTDSAVVHHGVLDESTNFIQKPFTPEALSRKVREVLGPQDESAPKPDAH